MKVNMQVDGPIFFLLFLKFVQSLFDGDLNHFLRALHGAGQISMPTKTNLVEALSLNY